MKRRRAGITLAAVAVVGATLGLAGWAGRQGTTAANQTAPNLDAVLAGIDKTGSHLTTLTAQAQATDYNKAADASSVSSGTLALQKTKSGPEMVLDLTTPADAARVFLYRNHTGYLYNPIAQQVDEMNLSGKQQVDEMLLLGLASSAAELRADFAIELLPEETVGGQQTIPLRLTPRNPSDMQGVTQVELWYDPQLWVAVQQRFLQAAGDYRQLNFTDVTLNAKIPASRFQPNFDHARVVKH